MAAQELPPHPTYIPKPTTLHGLPCPPPPRLPSSFARNIAISSWQLFILYFCDAHFSCNIQRVEARFAANTPQCTGQPLTAKNYPSLNVSSAEPEKPSLGRETAGVQRPECGGR